MYVHTIATYPSMNRPLIMKVLVIFAVIAVVLIGMRMMKGTPATPPAAS